MTDPINPDHYRRHGIELIDLIEHMPFSRGNAVKYLVRAGHKNPATELEDLRKAAWYIPVSYTHLTLPTNREV